MSSLDIDEFSEQTLELGEDYEGRVIATIIRSPRNKAGKPSVLYLHGFNDYFFQAHVAEKFNDNGYNFYALDLRKYGRSLLPHQHPNYCRSLREYFEEIDETLNIISTENKGAEIILLGHSNGALIGSLYLNEGNKRECINRFIMNSPFLQFNLPKWQRLFLLPMAGVVSIFFPYASQKKPFSHLYSESISEKKRGEWKYNTDWKPLKGFPAYLKWVHAVYRAQKKLHKESKIEIPILILHSDQSSRQKKWKDIIHKSDMVLNIKHMKRYGKDLGEDVTFAEIPNAMHDIFLSEKRVRNQAFQKMFDWLE